MINRTARQTYIAMLRTRVAAIDSQPDEEKEHFLWAELIAAGYLNGHTRFGLTGLPTGNIISGPTFAGRLMLQELEEKERNATLSSKLMKYVIPAGAYLLGLLSPIIEAIIKKKFGL